ncbi:MAG: protein methyltransferase [Desulfurococcales archaeon ex4484_58]|nr:MAG: protein methyltransferase [Desulfurococcales archaeon ex4484_58]
MFKLNYGDLVTVYIDEKRRYVVRLQPGKILGTDKGFIKHDDIVGKSYGESIHTSQGYKAYLLNPLLADHQYSIERVTQIIYPKDASYMIYLSSIGPGSKVLEAGVGSGYLTISLANFVGENGVVYGYDINEEHLEKARENLARTGLLDRVVLCKGDVRKELKHRDLDAVFLDLPDPWNALNSIYKVLKPAHPVLIYVPTINQVEKTVIGMKRSGLFIDIHIYELLMREYEVEEGATKPRTFMVGHTGYIVFGRKII